MNLLQDSLKFLSFTHKFQQVKRVILVKGENRDENDFEHSYQLALLAWYFIEHQKLNLNLDKVIRYALIHDLVEVYAGDTFFYDQNSRQSKNKREQKSLSQITKQFPEFPSLINWIKNYETKSDKESKFVYALDKIIPILNIYLDNGRSWKRDKVTLQMIVDGKTSKVSIDKTIANYFDQLIILLEQHHDQLFPA